MVCAQEILRITSQEAIGPVGRSTTVQQVPGHSVANSDSTHERYNTLLYTRNGMHFLHFIMNLDAYIFLRS